MTVGLEKTQLVSVFPGKSAGDVHPSEGSQLRRRGENFGQEHRSTNVVPGPANPWDLQQSSPQERPNQGSFTKRAAMACSNSRDRSAEFRDRVQSLKVQNLNSSNANLRHTNGSAAVVAREADQFNDIAR